MRRAVFSLIVTLGLLISTPASAQTTTDPFGQGDPFQSVPAEANEPLTLTVHLYATGNDDIDVRGLSSAGEATGRSVVVQAASALGLDSKDYSYDSAGDDYYQDDNPADYRISVRKHLAKATGSEWNYELETSKLQRVAKINDFTNYVVNICAATNTFDTLPASIAGRDTGDNCTSWARSVDDKAITVGIHESPTNSGFHKLVQVQTALAVALFVVIAGLLLLLRKKNRARFFGRRSVWPVLTALILSALVWLAAAGVMATDIDAMSEHALAQGYSEGAYLGSYFAAPLLPGVATFIAFLLIIFFGPRSSAQPAKQKAQTVGGLPSWLPSVQNASPQTQSHAPDTASWASDLVGQPSTPKEPHEAPVVDEAPAGPAQKPEPPAPGWNPPS